MDRQLAQLLDQNTACFPSDLHRVHEEDLTLGVAMTDAKGEGSKRRQDQAQVDRMFTINDLRCANRAS